MCKKNIGCEKHSKAQTHTQHSRVTTHLLYGEQVKLFDHYSSFTFLWKLCFCRRHTQRCSYKFFSFCSQGRTGHENRVDWGKNSGEFFFNSFMSTYLTILHILVYNTLTLVLHQSTMYYGTFIIKRIKMLHQFLALFEMTKFWHIFDSNWPSDPQCNIYLVLQKINEIFPRVYLEQLW